ncbi:MAG TPA: hypothetical protein VFO85_14035, partial [Vicinamibacteria bacterium]|nr:hypothetical protein [Vicinamibacteria bacterium]
MTQSKVLQQVVPVVDQPLERRQASPAPEPKRRRPRRRAASTARKARPEALKPRELKTVMDDALAR